MTTVADLGYPILVGIMIFWAIMAVAGILMSLVDQGKIKGRKLMNKIHSHSHSHHQYLEQ